MAEARSAPASIGVLTSGGDAPGMNPAVRAVVRTALHHGIDVYAIYEGYLGLVDGGDLIRRMESADVAGILQRGGTSIGTARSSIPDPRRPADGRPAHGGARYRFARRDRRRRQPDRCQPLPAGMAGLLAELVTPGTTHRPSPPLTPSCDWSGSSVRSTTTCPAQT